MERQQEAERMERQQEAERMERQQEAERALCTVSVDCQQEAKVYESTKLALQKRIDNTTLSAEEAWVNVLTPYLTGSVKALYIPKSIFDLVIGNVDGARNHEDPDTSMVVGAVTTRAQARKEGKPRALEVPERERHAGIDRTELIKLKSEDQVIQETARATDSKGNEGKLHFKRRRGVVYRDNKKGGIIRQVVLPASLRNYVISVAHDPLQEDIKASTELRTSQVLSIVLA
ncbi:hypothetical protein EGW08_018392 [Elysia chlorotica]|uniref:Uncharacterized protein n=1 Tax=Elysia chlorotica TaxID=188477 RepID=A0A3S1H7N5_ELYCH|nr:hypothetical protein EGW08_018392 [Elysia chlorotica]